MCEPQEIDWMNAYKLFTREGTLPIDMRGIEQTFHIEGLPRLDPYYHMIRFFDL